MVSWCTRETLFNVESGGLILYITRGKCKHLYSEEMNSQGKDI